MLRDDFGPKSDIDVLVEFEPNNTPGSAFFAMQMNSLNPREQVDLNTPEFLSPYFRDKVLTEAERVYVPA